MDADKFINNLTKSLYERDVNDAPRFSPPRARPPRLPISTKQIKVPVEPTPVRPIQYEPIPSVQKPIAPIPQKPIAPIPQKPVGITPLNEPILPSKRPDLRVTIDSNGRVRIPKEWFGSNGKLKFPKSEVDKAVQSARIQHRAVSRLRQARTRMSNASERMSANYGREIEIIGRQFSFPNLTQKAMIGIVSIGVLGGLSFMLLGSPAKSDDDNLQQAINNGSQLLSDFKQPMIGKAIQETTDLINDLKQLNQQSNLPTEVKTQIIHLAEAYKLLTSFRQPTINSPVDAQSFVQKADDLAKACENASTALQAIKENISSQETIEKIETLSSTLDEIFMTINNSKEARGKA